MFILKRAPLITLLLLRSKQISKIFKAYSVVKIEKQLITAFLTYFQNHNFFLSLHSIDLLE